MPSVELPGAFDDEVGTISAVEARDFARRIAGAHIDDAIGPERGGPLQTIIAATGNRDLAHPALTQREQMKQPERSRTHDQHAFERLRLRHFMRMHHAGERLQQRGLFEREIIGHAKRVLPDDMRRDEQVVRVGTEQHLLHRLRAEIFLPALAIETDSTRRGRRGHQRVANFEIVTPSPTSTTTPENS